MEIHIQCLLPEGSTIMKINLHEWIISEFPNCEHNRNIVVINHVVNSTEIKYDVERSVQLMGSEKSTLLVKLMADIQQAYKAHIYSCDKIIQEQKYNDNIGPLLCMPPHERDMIFLRIYPVWNIICIDLFLKKVIVFFPFCIVGGGSLLSSISCTIN